MFSPKMSIRCNKGAHTTIGALWSKNNPRRCFYYYTNKVISNAQKSNLASNFVRNPNHYKNMCKF